MPSVQLCIISGRHSEETHAEAYQIIFCLFQIYFIRTESNNLSIFSLVHMLCRYDLTGFTPRPLLQICHKSGRLQDTSVKRYGLYGLE